MKNEVFTTPYFDNRYKRLAKKFASLENDVDNLVEKLLENPKTGESLGAGIYKTRLAIESKGKGKSGGLGQLLICTKKLMRDAQFTLLLSMTNPKKAPLQKRICSVW